MSQQGAVHGPAVVRQLFAAQTFRTVLFEGCGRSYPAELAGDRVGPEGIGEVSARCTCDDAILATLINAPAMQLSADECKLFGLTPDEGAELSACVMARVGYVLGGNGRGGAGVFVAVDDTSTALLTASHVIVPAILGGELTVAHYTEGVARSIEPTAIRVAARADAALVMVERPPGAPGLARAEWALNSAPAPKVGQGVIAAGAPGEWKSDPDVVRRVISSARTLLFWTAITNVDAGGLIECDVDEHIATRDLARGYRRLSCQRAGFYLGCCLPPIQRRRHPPCTGWPSRNTSSPHGKRGCVTREGPACLVCPG